MTEVLQKYRILIILLVFMILTTVAIFIMISKKNTDKIPSRGVFVTNCIYENRLTS